VELVDLWRNRRKLANHVFSAGIHPKDFLAGLYNYFNQSSVCDVRLLPNI